jgi:uncharacterized Tic20 family protein
MSQDSPDGIPGYPAGDPGQRPAGRPAWPYTDPFGQQQAGPQDEVADSPPGADPEPPYLPQPGPYQQNPYQQGPYQQNQQNPYHPGYPQQYQQYPPPYQQYPGQYPGAQYPGQYPGAQYPGPPPHGQQPYDPAFAAARSWAIASYLFCFVGFLGPLILWAVRKDDDGPFGRYHSTQAVNLALTYLIYSVVLWILAIAAPAAGAALLFLLWLGVTGGFAGLAIAGAVSASRGTYFRIPRWLCLSMMR